MSRSLTDDETKQAEWMCSTSRSLGLDDKKQAR